MLDNPNAMGRAIAEGTAGGPSSQRLTQAQRKAARERQAEAYALEMAIHLKRAERERKKKELEAEFAGVFGDYDRGDAPGTHHPHFTYTLLILLLSFTSVILLNAMIALMSESFVRVTEQKQAELTNAKAALIVELSCPLSARRRRDNDRRFRWTYRILPESELAATLKEMREGDAKLADVKHDLEKLAAANSTLMNDNAELKEMMKQFLAGKKPR